MQRVSNGPDTGTDPNFQDNLPLEKGYCQPRFRAFFRVLGPLPFASEFCRNLAGGQSVSVS